MSLLFSLLAIGAVSSAVIAVVTVQVTRSGPVADDLASMGLWFAALIAVTATAGSLYYSESAGFVPCEFCWYQRIAMYPLAVILPIAAWRRDRGGTVYAAVLASAGVVLSIYHLYLQNGGGSENSCRSGVPCSAKLVDQWGVFTIPTMALCGFLGILGWSWVAWTAGRTAPHSPLPHDDEDPR